MFGVPGRRVDRFLQIMSGVDVAQEELRGPLILLIAAGRAPGHVGFAVAVAQGRRQRGARPLARRQRVRMIGVERERNAAIGHENAGRRQHAARPVFPEQRLDIGDGEPAFVDRAIQIVSPSSGGSGQLASGRLVGSHMSRMTY